MICLPFQLINLAILHGDKHKPTMKMADHWLLVRFINLLMDFPTQLDKNESIY